MLALLAAGWLKRYSQTNRWERRRKSEKFCGFPRQQKPCLPNPFRQNPRFGSSQSSWDRLTQTVSKCRMVAAIPQPMFRNRVVIRLDRNIFRGCESNWKHLSSFVSFSAGNSAGKNKNIAVSYRPPTVAAISQNCSWVRCVDRMFAPRPWTFWIHWIIGSSLTCALIHIFITKKS